MATRSATSWEEGDVIYLRFSKHTGTVVGTATYNIDDDSWSVRYYGTLLRDEQGTVEAYYFEEPSSATSSNVSLTASTGVYYSSEGKYTYPTGGDLAISAVLSPLTSRIRFKGEPDAEYVVEGITSYSEFNLNNNTFSKSAVGIPIKVRPDGYTPYIYGLFTDPDTPKLSLTEGTIQFTTDCPSSMFLVGRSGWLNLPTEDSHNGWAMGVAPSGVVDGHQWINLGLSSGILWAASNVGAVSSEAQGNYYAWGEVKTKSTYSLENYKYYNASSSAYTKYNSTDEKTLLDPADDAAYVNWGKHWLMPSQAQFQELYDECEWTWTTQNGVNGYKVQSKSNENSIFFPAVNSTGSYTTLYWSRSIDNTSVAFLWFDDTEALTGAYQYRQNAALVRPIYNQEKSPVQYVTNITISNTSLALSIGETKKLSATLSPQDAVVSTIRWTSSDESVATVSSDGLVKGVSKGVATISVVAADGGGAQASCNVTVSALHNGHEYVDLGLSVKWATMNINASSPEEYGDYYAWGETTAKSVYNWSTYSFCSGSQTTLNKYNNSSSNGYVDNKTTLDTADDVARQKWGGMWRIPTYNELDELCSQCTWSLKTQNGIFGYSVTSKKNGQSIFLPASGWYRDSSNSIEGSDGYYWSSSLNSSYPLNAYCLMFLDGWDGAFIVGGPFSDKLENQNRCNGMCIRAVCP